MTFQTGVRTRPELVVEAADVADVQRAVTRGLPVSAQATGHGATSSDGGVLITTNRLDHVHIDPSTRVADVGAGVTWDAVVREAARHGLAPLSGTSPTVGVAGYTLGGGLSPLSRRYGYAADHVLSIDLVLASGEHRRVTADDEDLFWALRGAGRSFGIVTSLRFKLFPVDRILGGSLTFDPARFPEVLEHYREWTAAIPDELTSALALTNFPDSPGMPPPLRGRKVLRVLVIGGDEPALEPLRRIGVLEDTIRPIRYADVTKVIDEPTTPHGFQGDAVVADDLDPTADVADLFGPGAEHAMFLVVHHLGGAMAGPPTPANAIGHRDARFLVRATTPVVHPAAPEISALHRTMIEKLGRGSTRRMLNFLFGDAPGQAAQCYEPADYRRLTELKRRLDPDGLIQPARGL